MARYGGEEFVIVLPETKKRGAYNVAERIKGRINDTLISCDSNPVKFSASFGVAEYKREELTQGLDSVIKKVDSNLYHAKQNGRNTVYGEL